MKSLAKIIILLVVSSISFACSSKQEISSSEQEIETEVSSNDENGESSIEPIPCDNHVVEEIIIKQATIIEPGVKRLICPNCGQFTDNYFYDLNEFDFSNTTYMYDGNEREILIRGLLPYGTHVVYENNKLTEIGTKQATAKIYDAENHLLATKTATLAIVENTGLPNIKITTSDGEDPDYHTQSDGTRPYKDMTVTVDNCADIYQKRDVPGEVKVRGNSTNQSGVGKRAFRMKMSSKTNFLGLNDNLKEKSWVLLADFFDQSRFRNETAFIMGDSLFNCSGYYCSDFMHVNLYMNGEDRGVYLLAEQQQAKDGRIPINEAKSSNTGTDIGYLVEIDGLVKQNNRADKTTGIGISEGDPCFLASSAGKVNNVSISEKSYVIKTDIYDDAQTLFIKKYITNCTKAFAETCNGNFKVVDQDGDVQDSPYQTMYETLNSYLDLDSFFRMYVLQEFLKDYDVGWGSFYLYVDFSSNTKVKRLTMSAPWDFDLGLGNKQSGGGWGGSSSSSDKNIPSSGISSTKDSFLNSSEYLNGMTTFNPWLYMLSQTNFFKDMFKKYYSVFDESQIFEKAINTIVYERHIFKDAFDLNHTNYVTNISSSAFNMQTRRYNSFDEAVDYLYSWLNERKAYLDNKYLA